MRAVLGLLLIMLGLAMAVVWMPEHNGERQLAVVTDIAIQGLPRRSEGSERGARTFAPGTPLHAAVEPPGERALHATAGVARVVTSKRDTQDRPYEPVAEPTSGQSIVTSAITMPPVVYHALASRAQTTETASAPARPDTVRGPEMSRYDLIRSIQRELKRVGCYAGDVDGDWGPGSRRAIIGFTDRVNATLPTAQPDFILLTLLQGHQGIACGRTCPAGQSLSDNGRCLPNAVLTHARAVQDNRQVAAVRSNPSQPSEWSTSTTHGPFMTNTGITPAAVAAAVTANPVASPIVTGHLSGRMSVGGPPTSLAALPAASPARAAVRPVQSQVSDQETTDQSVRAGTTARRDSSRRRTARGPARRYVYAPAGPGVVYRARRAAAPRYYASTARRTSRSWTATFFATQ